MMKKLLCVMLAVMMVLTLTACAKPLSEEIVGTWSTSVELDFAEAGLEGFDKVLVIPVLITFTDDGEVTIEVEEDGAKDAVEQLEADMEVYLMDIMLQTFIDQGYTREEAIYNLEVYAGIDLEAYIASEVANLDMYNSIVNNINSEGEYEVDDEELILEIDGDELEVELEDGVLTITEAEDEEQWEDMGFEFPVELTRVEE